MLCFGQTLSRTEEAFFCLSIYKTIKKQRRCGMKLSARNQLKGTIIDIQEGAVNGIVKIDIGGSNVISATISMNALRKNNSPVVRTGLLLFCAKKNDSRFARQPAGCYNRNDWYEWKEKSHCGDYARLIRKESRQASWHSCCLLSCSFLLSLLLNKLTMTV